MDRISRIGVFAAVVEEQSFAGAARRLGLTSSAVSKQVQNLELDLKVKLLNRTTRNVSVTEEGAIYYDRARRALNDLAEAENEILELGAHPRGPLKISLPQGLGITCLTEGVARFAATYPGVTLDVSLDDRFVDPDADGLDVVVRIGTLKDSSLIARRLASCPFVLCAAPGYLERRGVPRTPEDLAGHEVLVYSRNTSVHEWRYRDAAGEVGQVSLAGSFRSDSGEMLCQASIAGVGIVILPVFFVAEHLAAGRLVRLLPDHETWPERDIHAVFRPNRFQSTRLRLFVDHLVAMCKDLPWE
ncbi:LysR family transcriptional regulator [Roseovarius sp. SCSIO 43702]|uniref:LysR family transcriptional regulator n=1 Tax=Roseovarius sp. SCSIO 43702 TaxID=2823043 RepID=UPI001C736A42|nr:LysR family transcriptional regulator [Roseovarius sp. SCSIO 43702]QYX57132.1 LysR family transcriptional regulator [Roseovarius sp. SCSIO 43702]